MYPCIVNKINDCVIKYLWKFEQILKIVLKMLNVSKNIWKVLKNI